MHHCFMISSNLDLRELVAKARSADVFERVCQQLRDRYENVYLSEKQKTDDWRDCSVIPPYICQSYIRPEPKIQNLNSNKRPSEENDSLDTADVVMSKKKLKKMNRKLNELKSRPKCGSKRILCTLCPNPKGEKCDYGICRTCCRKKTFSESLDCAG